MDEESLSLADGDSALQLQILEKLDRSITSFQQSLDSGSHALYTQTNRIARWALQRGIKAHVDLSYFWSHLSRYCEESPGHYISICQVHINGTTIVKKDAFSNLETFWQSYTEKSNDRSYLYIVSKADVVTPKPKRSKALFASNSGPDPATVCESAAIAFLFLVREDLQLSFSDMYKLLTSFLAHNDSEYVPLLPEIYESDQRPAYEFPTSPDASTGDETEPLTGESNWPPPIDSKRFIWSSMESTSLIPKELENSSAIQVHFPGAFPYFRTDFQYMDIWEPHGFRPSSSMRSALWGSWNGDRSCWTSILFFADGQMASTFNRGLDNLTLTDQNRVTELTSHWAHSIQYIYAIGINNVRLSIRNSMKQIDSLKYENTAKPSTGYANVCQMALNHLEYHHRLMRPLRTGLQNLPSSWFLLYPTKWSPVMEALCDKLEDEIGQAIQSVKQSRSMVLEQHSLQQSRKATTLTILASIFIPASFVASFFSMNTVSPSPGAGSTINSGNITPVNGTSSFDTSESNGISASQNPWPTPTPTIFFAISIPLALLTVFLPLFFLPAFTYIARKATVPRFREVVIWGWLIGTFFLLLIYDILQFFYYGHRPRTFKIYMAMLRYNLGLFFIMTISFVLQFFGACWWVYHIRKERAGFRKALWRHKWRILLWVMLVVLFYVRWFWVRIMFPRATWLANLIGPVRHRLRGPYFLPLIPYVFLFVGLIVKSLWRRWKHSRRSKSSKDLSYKI